MTRDVEYSVHKGQNLLDDNLCKTDGQVDIYLKLLLIKSNPVAFLLIAKGELVCSFKSSVGEIFVSCYLFIIMSSLIGHSYLKHIRCFARFGTIFTIKKGEKHPWRNVTFSKVAGLLY